MVAPHLVLPSPHHLAYCRWEEEAGDILIFGPLYLLNSRACISPAKSTFLKVPPGAPLGSLKFLPRILFYGGTIIYFVSSVLRATQMSSGLLLKPSLLQGMCPCPHVHGELQGAPLHMEAGPLGHRTRAVTATPGPPAPRGKACLSAPGVAVWPSHLPPPPPPPGKYIENHGVVHNMYYNTTSKVKLPYHATLGIQRWWDNGSVPIWVTAQRQVRLPAQPLGWQTGRWERDLAGKGCDHVSPTAEPFPTLGVPGFLTPRGVKWGPEGGVAGCS